MIQIRAFDEAGDENRRVWMAVTIVVWFNDAIVAVFMAEDDVDFREIKRYITSITMIRVEPDKKIVQWDIPNDPPVNIDDARGYIDVIAAKFEKQMPMVIRRIDTILM